MVDARKTKAAIMMAKRWWWVSLDRNDRYVINTTAVPLNRVEA